jgi:alkylhydroperoxidase family enzyme
MSPADLDRLRSHGFDDIAIHDATQVVGYFNYVTRIADGLGIDPEDFIHPWGGDG